MSISNIATGEELQPQIDETVRTVPDELLKLIDRTLELESQWIRQRRLLLDYLRHHPHKQIPPVLLHL